MMQSEFIHEIHWIPPDDGTVTAASLILATTLIALTAVAYAVLVLRGLGGRLKAGSGAGTPFHVYANIVGIRLRTFSSFGETLRRFPLPVAAFVTFAFLFSRELVDNVQQEFGQFGLLSFVPRQPLGLIALASAFWFLAVKLWQESEKRPWPVALVLAVSGFAFIAWCIAQTPYMWHTLVPATVLLVTAAPFLRSGASSSSFWSFNRCLWSSVPIGLVAAGVFVAFIVLVFLPLGHLIGTNWFRSYFSPLMFVVSAFVGSVVALGGAPKTFRSESCEVGLLLFFLALALILIAASFLALLYLALGIIVFTGAWLRSGGLAVIFLLGVGVGVVTYLFVYPLRNTNILIRIYCRFFFWAWIPLVILFGAALVTRIDAYGVTEDRYLVGLLCVWLAISIIAFIAFKPSLKFLPLSLASLLILASFGPWGASAVSTRSQLGELEQVLKNSDLLIGNKITPASSQSVALQDRKRISSIVSYFTGSNKTDSLKAWLNGHGLHDVGYRPYDITRSFGFSYVHLHQTDKRPARVFALYRSRPELPSVIGFEDVQRVECSGDLCLTPPDVESSLSGNGLTISLDNDTEFAFDLTPLVALGKQLPSLERDEKMEVEIEKDGRVSRLIVESMTLREQDDALVVTYIRGLLLLGRTEETQ